MLEESSEIPTGNEIAREREPKFTEDIEAMIRTNPNHPFTRIAEKIKAHKLGIAASTFWGIHLNWITSEALRLAYYSDKMPLETFTEINEAFLPLQSANNIELNLGGMGMVAIANEVISGFLEGAEKEKWARISRKAIPILGAVTMAAMHTYSETGGFRGFTNDKNDLLFGLATIAPSFWALRTCYASDLKRLKEKGFAAAGKFKKTATNLDVNTASIAPIDLELQEMIRFPGE